MKIKDILFTTTTTYASLPLRLGVGVVMTAHGAQKLFGWFGGYGLQGTARFFSENLGLEPGLLMAVLAGGTEFFGGLFLLIGFLTRPAAVAIAFTMSVAIVTAKMGAFFASNNGMEYPLTLLLASVSLAMLGGGGFSIDGKLNGSKS